MNYIQIRKPVQSELLKHRQKTLEMLPGGPLATLMFRKQPYLQGGGRGALSVLSLRDQGFSWLLPREFLCLGGS